MIVLPSAKSTWNARPLPQLPTALKAAARRSLVLAGDWAEANQVRDAWPNWNANKGRFPYHARIHGDDTQPPMLSTCWKTARTAQGLFSAFSVTGDDRYLQAAMLACDYVGTLQVTDPGYQDWHGAFREDSPLGPHVALRDGIEAVQALVNAYQVTGQGRYLARATLGMDFVLRNQQQGRFRFSNAYPFEDRIGSNRDYFFFTAAAIPLCQLAAITGQKRYSKAAVPMMDRIVTENLMPSGALGIHGHRGNDHHVVAGEFGNVVSNDDGVGVAMLCVHRVTDKRKYLDAAVAMADFWVESGLQPQTYASLASVALFVADVNRLVPKKSYRRVLHQLLRHTIELQFNDPSRPLLHGCFIGEDMAHVYDKTSQPADWVDLRITSYALLALAKAAAGSRKQWGMAYSAFGW